ncbi:clusterin isoform X1 [Brachyhypopomus gauderio]|uniref:clusterin isoform X1 n=1 Tax=Brachyhypopomus gauderio TaxID=698409 RepID=UPI0040425ECD
MRACWSILGLSLLYISAECLVDPSKDDLHQISQFGEKYVDQEIETAINGVKEMKTMMEKSEEDHKTFISSLEKTKKQKEEALKAAQDMEEKLNEEQSVCNDTMQALWEECKPCLKNTCVKYYSRTCTSGSGLVGRQLEEYLNQASPFSIWINGQNIETLEKEDQQQSQQFQDLEKRYGEVADGVDNIFLDSMRVFDHMRSLHPYHTPSVFSRPTRFYRSPFHDPEFHGFQSMFHPMMEMARNIFGSLGPYMGGDVEFPDKEGSENEDVVITKPFGDDKMTCREIRRNSAGCIKLREECEKCKEIQHIDCSGKKPLEGPLKQELEKALALAERYTQEYQKLLKNFEEEMFKTSELLDSFNKQFGWVSSLANHTKSEDGIFKIKAVISRTSDDPEKQGDTNVSVQLFDEPEMSFTLPGDIPWNDPKFSEMVAKESLDRYKQHTVWVL